MASSSSAETEALGISLSAGYIRLQGGGPVGVRRGAICIGGRRRRLPVVDVGEAAGQLLLEALPRQPWRAATDRLELAEDPKHRIKDVDIRLVARSGRPGEAPRIALVLPQRRAHDGDWSGASQSSGPLYGCRRLLGQLCVPHS